MEGPEPQAPVGGRFEDFHRSVRTMLVARAVALPWAIFQIVTYSTMSYPRGVEAVGLALLVAIGVGNVALWFASARIKTTRDAQVVAIASLAMDVILISGFVWLFAFDQITAVWAIVFILPLEGAILFALPGALWAWAGATVLYGGREVWAAQRYGFPIEWNSVSFRMGIAFVIALVAGLMARDLVRQRAQLEGALEEVRRIDRLRSALVSTLAHDVRNPLTTIRGVHRTLLAPHRQIEPDKVIELLTIADRQSERLQRLAIDLLDLARLEQGRLDLAIQSVELRPAVEGALSYLEDSERFEVKIDEGLLVQADPGRLQQIVVNLASNSLRYGDPPFVIEGERVNGKVCLAFVDHGVGLPRHLQATVFEAFRAEEKKGSVGFGLAVVKALVEAQEGAVLYEDVEPTGACFKILLPPA